MNWDNSTAFEDEMYAFRPLEANRIHLLLTINTPALFIDPMGDAYNGATYVLPHPSSFCRQNIGQTGGRSWVTALGHLSGLPLPTRRQLRAPMLPGPCPRRNPLGRRRFTGRLS